MIEVECSSLLIYYLNITSSPLYGIPRSLHVCHDFFGLKKVTLYSPCILGFNTVDKLATKSFLDNLDIFKVQSMVTWFSYGP